MQAVPVLLTTFTSLLLIALVVAVSYVLNIFFGKSPIAIVFIPADILVGITIYLKTSVDFAFTIGTLVKKYTGITNQTIISVMTSIGNGIGTILVMLVWVIFRQNKILLAVMLCVAALALIHMASEGLRESPIAQKNFALKKLQQSLHTALSPLYFLFSFLFRGEKTTHKPESSLMLLSLSLPFLLGLDDFAGYIPLFSLVNVVSFATGVIVGHLILLVLLFIRPETTRRVMSYPWIEVIGSLIFLVLGILGIIELVTLIAS